MTELTIHDLDFIDGYIDELKEKTDLSDESYNEVKNIIKKERIKIKQ